MSDSEVQAADDRLLSGLREFLERPGFQRFIIALIVVNAIALGLETDAGIAARYGSVLQLLDQVVIGIFCVEISLKLTAWRGRFFRDPWNVFDFFVVAMALMPTNGAFSVLRSLRILRALRLLSVAPSLRRVVAALLGALPGMASIALLLMLILYVAAVMGTRLFAEASPEYFGTLGRSLFTLFQVMTLEAWPDVARPLMEAEPWAWIFFVCFIMVTTFTVLNLVIAVIVNAMEQRVTEEIKAEQQAERAEAHDERDLVMQELRALREAVDRLQR